MVIRHSGSVDTCGVSVFATKLVCSSGSRGHCTWPRSRVGLWIRRRRWLCSTVTRKDSCPLRPDAELNSLPDKELYEHLKAHGLIGVLCLKPCSSEFARVLFPLYLPRKILLSANALYSPENLYASCYRSFVWGADRPTEGTPRNIFPALEPLYMECNLQSALKTLVSCSSPYPYPDEFYRQRYFCPLYA